jgi:uncharacterized protein (TIGR04255 family)
MSTETYKHAPITEAALDIRVRLAKEITTVSVESLKDDDYPKLKQHPVQMQVRIGPIAADGTLGVPVAEAINTPLGFTYESADGRQVFQVRTDGFTLNRLAPYQNWDLFAGEARRLWKKYKELAHPEYIELLGLNYINHIFVPEGMDLSNHLRTYPEVSPVLPQLLNTFAMSFQATWPGEEQILLFVSQAIGPVIKPGFATIVLSIQAFKPLQRSAADVDEEEIWMLFGKLREVKNAVFEGCITDMVREEIR